MDKHEIDQRLRAWSEIELAMQKDKEVALTSLFSNAPNQKNWTIHSEKLMEEGEDIAIHKHDRFVPFAQHSHDYIELMYVYDGSVIHHIHDKVIELNKGEILLLDMNIEHSIEAAKEGDIAINILIRKEFFDWYFIKQIAYHDLISNFVLNALYGKNNEKAYIHFHTAANENIQEFALRIMQEFFENRNGYQTAIRAFMLLLFNELIRDYQKYMSERMVQRIDASIVVEILEYIDQNYKTVTLKDLADFFNYSPDYIGKQIKKHTGKTLKDLLREKKLRQAGLLLKDTEITIMELLDEIGYSNVSYFYKQFREEYGTTPDDYRKVQKQE